MTLKNVIGPLAFLIGTHVCFGTVTIDDLPARSGAPLGMNGKIQVTATGSGDLSYQWYLDNEPIPEAVDAFLDIPANNETGTLSYRVRVRDDDSEVLSEVVTYKVFDVAEELGIPGHTVVVERSIDNRYTYMLHEEGGIFLSKIPEPVNPGPPQYEQTSSSLRIGIQNSALVKVTVDGFIRSFGSLETNGGSISIGSQLNEPTLRTETNYFMGEGTHWLSIHPTLDPWLTPRYTASTIIKKIEVIPIPDNYFLADMYRYEFAHTGQFIEREIGNLDFDNDGRSNLVEWMERTNPFFADKGIQIELTSSGEGGLPTCNTIGYVHSTSLPTTTFLSIQPTC